MKMQNKKLKKIKHLVSLSSTEGKLDPRKILFIAKTLRRNELRLYHRYLLRKRKEEKVVVTTVTPLPKSLSLRIGKAFPKKDVLFRYDLKALGGMKVQFADFVFDATVRGYLAAIRKTYKQSL